MKIVLIRPQRVFKKFNKALKPCPPLGLAIIAASLEKAGYSVTVIDGIVEGISKTSKLRDEIFIQGLSNQEIIERIPCDADVIGLSCMFTVDWLNLRLLISEIAQRFPRATLIAGGEHITALPEMCLREAPGLKICVLGEGEETMLELCASLQSKVPVDSVKGIAFRKTHSTFVVTQKRNRLKFLDSLPIPAWHLFPTEIYFREKLSFGVGGMRTLPILATRGCPFTCTFCSSADMWGTQYSMRSVQNVVDEIEYLIETYDVRNIDLYDLTAIIRASWIREFCQEIIHRKLKITWQLPSGTRSEAITPEVLKYMRLSGCTVVSYAPESGSDRILQLVRKKVNLRRMLTAIANSNRAGLIVKINIIIGLPEERHSDLIKTLWFILRSSWSGAYDMGPNPFHPIPGTALFVDLQKQGRVDPNNEKYYDDLLNADNLWKVSFYNKIVHPAWLKFYIIFSIILFYSTNFIFRPIRFWLTVKNVFTFNAQTRGQYVLQRIIEQSRFGKRQIKRRLSPSSR